MKKIEIIAALPDIRRIVDLIQRRGVMEIAEPDEQNGLQQIPTDKSAAQYGKYLSVVSAALAELNKYHPSKTELSKSLVPNKKELTFSEYLQYTDEVTETLNLCYDIHAAAKAIAEARALIGHNEEIMKGLEAWLNLDLPLRFSGTRTTAAFIGTLPAQYTAADLEGALLPMRNGTNAVACEIISSAKGRTNVMVLCHTDSRASVLTALRNLGFAAPADPTGHPPAVRYECCRRQTEEAEQSIKQNEKKMKEYAESRSRIEFASDYLSICKEKYSRLHSLCVTDSVFVLSGFIAEKDSNMLAKELTETFDAAVSITEPAPGEEIPVLLQNNSFGSAVESITNMYSPPGANDVDPNPVMAFFYYALFGIMLSDAGYGLIMVLGTWFAKRRFKLRGNLKETANMYFYCGIATMFWGALFGSWFGDIVNVVALQFFNRDIGSLALWFEPVTNPMKLMLFAFLFGVLHLFAGLGVSFYNMWHHGNKIGALCDIVPVYLFITGLMPLGAGIVITVPPALIAAGKFLMLSGAVLIIAAAGRNTENILGKLGLGLYGLYNTASGWLSDILSYSRLLALGLCTGVIAQVVNTLGTIPANKIAKLCLLIPVFIFGHAVNMAINLIGAYVHTNRLQYVEFFSKFYEGGGRSFAPLKINTDYYEIKEE